MAQLKLKPAKTTAVGHIKASSILCTNQSSSHSMTTISIAANSDNNKADVQAKKRRKKGNGSAEVLMVFNHINPDNNGEGYECDICM